MGVNNWPACYYCRLRDVGIVKLKTIIGIGMIPACFTYCAFKGILSANLNLVNIDFDRWCDGLERKLHRMVLDANRKEAEKRNRQDV